MYSNGTFFSPSYNCVFVGRSISFFIFVCLCFLVSFCLTSSYTLHPYSHQILLRDLSTIVINLTGQNSGGKEAIDGIEKERKSQAFRDYWHHLRGDILHGDKTGEKRGTGVGVAESVGRGDVKTETRVNVAKGEGFSDDVASGRAVERLTGVDARRDEVIGNRAGLDAVKSVGRGDGVESGLTPTHYGLESTRIET